MSAKDIYNQWLNNPAIDGEIKEELRAIAENEEEIEERFYKELEFGTAGLRGKIGAGTNCMNKYTVAKATKGLADYINSQFANTSGDSSEITCEKAVAIACDSRIKSDEFSKITAGVLNANGIKAYVFEDLRPTPELSFTIRHLNCIAGVNITASHNPSNYNGYKAYWSDGAQITSPHDTLITECIKKIDDYFSLEMMDRKEAEEKGLYVEIGKEVDEAYVNAVLNAVKEDGITKAMAENVVVGYTPLNGAGITIMPELFERCGFTNVHIVEEQKNPDGNFPTVPYPNPEMEATFEYVEKLGRKVGADVLVATDPDADRLGVHVRDKEGNYHSLTGNMVGSLLCMHELERLSNEGKLPEKPYVVSTVVSTKLIDKIAAAYGAEVRRCLTGFKHICGEINKAQQNKNGNFVFGFEESCGFLTGDYTRDKDGCASALAICETCAYYKEKGMTLWDAIEEMYEKFGYSLEETVSIVKEGIDGAQEIKKMMSGFRNTNPTVDYAYPEKTGLPKADVVSYDFENSWVCIRPSGTEPKIKFYFGVNVKEKEEAQKILQELKKNFIK